MAHIQKRVRSGARTGKTEITDESDAQVELAEHDLDSPQSVRAFRGRITRRLLEELKTSIAFYFDYIGVS